MRILHERLLGKALGIGEEAVRDEKHLRYIRGLDAAVEEARKGAAQIAFLLKPTSVQQVADTSFARRRDAAEVHRLLSQAALRPDHLQAGLGVPR